MIDKKTFCTLLDAHKEAYDNSIKLYDVLKPFSISFQSNNDPRDIAFENIIKDNFTEWEQYDIISYAFPIGERKNISSEELYDLIMNERKRKILSNFSKKIEKFRELNALDEKYNF